MANLVNNLGGPAGFGTGVLDRNDDESTARIDISSLFPSGINLYGTYFTGLYINNNGNVTFTAPLASFTPTSIGAGFSSPIIAPFWADVDTRGPATTSTGGNSAGTNLVYYNLDQANKTITITWDDVGYYAFGTKKDAFQLQLVSHGTSATGINLIYQAVQWTTGSASGGSNGLGGQVARVGFSAGDGVHYYELPASANQAALLALPSTTGNTGIVGEWQFFTDDTGIYSVLAPPQPGAPSIAQENAAGYASTGNLTVSGTAQANATVTVLDGIARVGTTTASAAGTYSLTLGTALADASHAITVTATDSYGNASAQSATNTVIVDTAAPVVAITSAAVITNQTGQTIRGTVSDLHPGTTVSIFDNGSATALATATVVGGAWSATVTLSGEGSHSLVARDTDLAGNTGSSAAVVHVLDITAPTLTAGESISGLTRLTSNIISGTVSDANGIASVQVRDGATILGNAAITGSTWSFNATGLGDGSHSFTAIATDNAGNASAAVSAGAAVTVDSVAPVVSITSAAVTTNQAAQTIAGRASDAHPGSTVSLFDNGSASPLGTATIAADGTWSTSVTLAGQGSHSLVARHTDAAGNIGSSTAVVEVLDTVAPVVAITSTAVTTNQATQTIAGTVSDAHPGSTVSLYDNGSLLQSNIAVSNGTWSTSITLNAGSNSLVAKHTDAAGNTGSSAALVDVLGLPPVVTLAAAPAADNATHAVLGTAAPGYGADALSVTLTADAAFSSGSSITLSGGNLIYTPGLVTAAKAGSDVISYTVTDLVTGAVTLETQTITLGSGPAPAVTVATGATASNTSTAILGTTSPGYGNAYLSGYQTADNGLFTYISTDDSVRGTLVAQTNDWHNTASFANAVLVPGVTNYLHIEIIDYGGPGGLIGTYTLTGTGVAFANGTQTLSTNTADWKSVVQSLNGTFAEQPWATPTNTPMSVGVNGASPWGTRVNIASTANWIDDPATGTAASQGATLNNGFYTVDFSVPINVTYANGAPHPLVAALVSDARFATGSSVTLGTSGVAGTNIVYTPGLITAGLAGSDTIVYAITDTVTGAVTTRTATITLDNGPAPVVTLASAPAADNVAHAILGTVAPGFGADALSVTLTSDAAFSSGSSIAISGGTLVYTPGLVTAGKVGSDVISYRVTDMVTGAVTLETQTITLGNGPAPMVAITSGAVLTNGASQTLSGTVSGFEPGATVSLYDNGSLLGTAAVSGGTWSANVTLAGDGTHSLVARNTNAGGATGTSAAVVDTLDTLAPVVAITSAALDTNQATQTVTGTVSDLHAGSTVAVFDNGAATPLATAAVAANGSWSASVTLAGQGAHSLVARSTDLAGNTGSSAAVVDVLDTIAPVVVITAPASLANSAARIISGTVTDTQPGSTVSIFNNGGTAPIGTATIDANGGWTTTVTLPTEGSNSLVARNTDRAGNIGSSAAVVDVLDTVAPVVSITSAPVLTNQPTQTIAGTVSDLHPGSTVALFVDFLPAGTASVDATGHWSADVTFSGQGNHNLVAGNIDQAGNPGFSAALIDVLDTVAPVVAITSAAVTTKQATQTVTGTASDLHLGGTVLVYDNGSAVGSATVGANGTWSASVTLVGEGSHSLVAQADDAAGNTGTSAAVVDVLDTSAPTLTVGQSVAGLTNQTTAVLSGTVGDLNGVAHVEIYDGATDLGAATLTPGAWSFTATGLSEGSHSFTAIATDSAGNATAARPAGASVIIDLTPPQVIITSAPVVTAAAVQTIAGTVSDLHPGSTVLIFDNGAATPLATAAVLADGSWSTSVTLPVTGLNSLVARTTDLAGNTGTSAAVVDVLGPPPVVTLAAHPSADNGTPAVLGTAVTAYLNDALSVSLDADADYASGSRLELVGNNLVYSPGLVTTAQIGTDTITFTVTDTVTGAQTTRTQIVVLGNGPGPSASLASAPAADNVTHADLGSFSGFDGHALAVSLIDDATYASGSRLDLVGGHLFYTPGLVTTAQAGADLIHYRVTDTVTGAFVTEAQSVMLNEGPNPVVTLASAPLASNAASATLGTVAAGWGHDPLAITLLSDSVFGSGSSLHLVAGSIVYTPGVITSTKAGADRLDYVVTDLLTGAATQVSQLVQLATPGKTAVYLDGWNNMVGGPMGGPVAASGAAGPTILGAPYGNADVVGTGFSETVIAQGWNNHVFGNGGNDVLRAGQGQATVQVNDFNGDNSVSGSLGLTAITLGSGDNTIQASGFNNSIQLGDGNNSLSGPLGNSTVVVGHGDNHIALSGFGNAVTLGNGHNMVTAGLGNDTVHAGHGDLEMTLAGYNDVVVAGAGNHSLHGSLGNLFVQLGAGLNTVDAGGFGNRISVAGHSSVHAGAGGAQVSVSGMAEVWLAGWNNKVDGSGATDLTVHAGSGNGLYIAPAAGAGVEHIFGFNLAGGDQVQFRGVGQSAISFHAHGGDLDLLVDGTMVAELIGLGGINTQSLFDHHALVFA